jgi:hypothetical protein
LNPYLTTGSYDVAIYNGYIVEGPAGWLGYVYASDGTACATVALGDTGNCNHTTKQASSGSIYVNTYYSPAVCAKANIVGHELGHVWGLDHDSFGLMYGTVNCDDWQMSHVSWHMNAYY